LLHRKVAREHADLELGDASTIDEGAGVAVGGIRAELASEVEAGDKEPDRWLMIDAKKA
jgi:hypothetical protein